MRINEDKGKKEEEKKKIFVLWIDVVIHCSFF